MIFNMNLINRLENYQQLLKSKNQFRVLNNNSGIDFCSNDYLGIKNHPQIIKDTQIALDNYGFGAGSSRFIKGEHKYYEKLEYSLADFKQTQKSLLFSSGYAANIGAICALIEPGDLVFSDELNHASIIDALKLSKASVIIFKHCDQDDLTKKIKENPHKTCKFLISESLFSMDGDIAPLDTYTQIAKEHNLNLIIDESHALGLYGKNGAGLVNYFNIQNDILLTTQGLGKAFGSLGGVCAGSELVIQHVLQKARTLMYSTALPPSILAGIYSALNIVKQGDDLREKLFNNVSFFAASLRGAIAPPVLYPSPIFPIIIGDSALCLEIAQKLNNQGFDVKAIRPPTVPINTSRLRISININHTHTQLTSLAQSINELL